MYPFSTTSYIASLYLQSDTDHLPMHFKVALVERVEVAGAGNSKQLSTLIDTSSLEPDGGYIYSARIKDFATKYSVVLHTSLGLDSTCSSNIKYILNK